jgi:hypothetical protein
MAVRALAKPVDLVLAAVRLKTSRFVVVSFTGELILLIMCVPPGSLRRERL